MRKNVYIVFAVENHSSFDFGFHNNFGLQLQNSYKRKQICTKYLQVFIVLSKEILCLIASSKASCFL